MTESKIVVGMKHRNDRVVGHGREDDLATAKYIAYDISTPYKPVFYKERNIRSRMRNLKQAYVTSDGRLAYAAISGVNLIVSMIQMDLNTPTVTSTTDLGYSLNPAWHRTTINFAFTFTFIK